MQCPMEKKEEPDLHGAELGFELREAITQSAHLHSTLRRSWSRKAAGGRVGRWGRPPVRMRSSAGGGVSVP